MLKKLVDDRDVPFVFSRALLLSSCAMINTEITGTRHRATTMSCIKGDHAVEIEKCLRMPQRLTFAEISVKWHTVEQRDLGRGVYKIRPGGNRKDRRNNETTKTGIAKEGHLFCPLAASHPLLWIVPIRGRNESQRQN